MAKLYIQIWNEGKYRPDEWHASSVETNEEIAKLEHKLACLRSPTLQHYLIEIEQPTQALTDEELVESGKEHLAAIL